jgi:hypothetical protein
MKTLLVLALLAVSAYAFGPSLFQGELRIFGTKTPTAETTVQAPTSEPVAPAVYVTKGASPIFPRPESRPATRKAQENAKEARSWRPAPTPPNCWGPVCYYDSPEMRSHAPMALPPGDKY